MGQWVSQSESGAGASTERGGKRSWWASQASDQGTRGSHDEQQAAAARNVEGDRKTGLEGLPDLVQGVICSLLKPREVVRASSASKELRRGLLAHIQSLDALGWYKPWASHLRRVDRMSREWERRAAALRSLLRQFVSIKTVVYLDELETEFLVEWLMAGGGRSIEKFAFNSWGADRFTELYLPALEAGALPNLKRAWLFCDGRAHMPFLHAVMRRIPPGGGLEALSCHWLSFRGVDELASAFHEQEQEGMGGCAGRRLKSLDLEVTQENRVEMDEGRPSASLERLLCSQTCLGLQTLALTGAEGEHLTDRDVAAVASFMLWQVKSGRPGLRELVIGPWHEGQMAAGVFSKAIRAGAFRSLEQLWFNGAGGQGSLRIIIEAMVSAGGCSRLQEFEMLSADPFEPATASLLPLACPALSKLVLRHCGLTDEAVKVLVCGLKAHPSMARGLRELVLCDECYCDSPTFGNRAAAAISSALGEGVLPQLEVLDLRGTCVGDAGVVLLAKTLESLGDACRLNRIDISERVLNSPSAHGRYDAKRRHGGLGGCAVGRSLPKAEEAEREHRVRRQENSGAAAGCSEEARSDFRRGLLPPACYFVSRGPRVRRGESGRGVEKQWQQMSSSSHSDTAA